MSSSDDLEGCAMGGVILLIIVMIVGTIVAFVIKGMNDHKLAKEFVARNEYVKVVDVIMQQKEHTDDEGGKTYSDAMFIFIEGKNEERQCIKKSNVTGPFPLKGEFWSVKVSGSSLDLVSKVK
jgi:hypothetical protein